ncbi:MAG TPA: non-canonical purine NTP pyrophosphatase [Granulicella sp.]|nr:non-canonical purine NTP pyrophosphatase [Granulicella sp.]
MVRFLLASTNAGKLRDFEYALGLSGADGGFDLAPLPGLREIAAPAEDEASFADNARVKAIYYSRFAPGEMVLADDSGLEVDVLGGAPGVRSARYAEDCGFVVDSGLSVDERNNLCLLAALGEVPEERRGARYRCVLAAARDGVVVATGVGAVEGRIVAAARGDMGFGYDPYFVPEGVEETMAELDMERRLGLSHRGRALVDLLGRLGRG